MSRVEVVAPGVGLDKGYSGLLDFFVWALEIRIDRLQSDWTLEEGGLIKIAIFFHLLRLSILQILEVLIDVALFIGHSRRNHHRLFHDAPTDGTEQEIGH